VYTVSTMGTTGARTDVDDAARALADRIAARADATGTTALRCVGLGISTPEQVRDVLSYADGAIVGSALVRALGAGGVPAVRELAASLAAGTLDGGPADVAAAQDPPMADPSSSASVSPASDSPEKDASA
jgi:tryptophan synthase alpha chain